MNILIEKHPQKSEYYVNRHWDKKYRVFGGCILVLLNGELVRQYKVAGKSKLSQAEARAEIKKLYVGRLS